MTDEQVVDIEEETQDEPVDYLGGEPVYADEPIEDAQADPTEDAHRQMWNTLDLDPAEFDRIGPESRRVRIETTVSELRQSKALDTKAEDAPSQETQTTPDEPPQLKAPQFDEAAITEEFADAFDEGNKDGISRAFAKSLEISRGLQVMVDDVVKLAVNALSNQDGRLDEIGSQMGHLTRPRQLEKALGSVQIATQDDFPAADQLLASGDAKSPEDALIMAAGRRINSEGRQDPVQVTMQANDAARQKALGRRASRQATGSNRQAPSQVTMPVESHDSPEGKRLLMELQAESGQSP